jgi:DNA-directed RNA polymerase specialized sigma54-like protein
MIEELFFMLKANPFVPFTIRTIEESFEIQRSTVSRLSKNSLFVNVGTQTVIIPFTSMQLIFVHGISCGEPTTSKDS